GEAEEDEDARVAEDVPESLHDVSALVWSSCYTVAEAVTGDAGVAVDAAESVTGAGAAAIAGARLRATTAR
ncbi:hypothetical protein ACP3WW_23065, partial [Salmonella enterica]|uniref:hypothetical protein n=1 Tax=Salmonella enterica TaxID=28901 RepID=UPI003CEBF580